MNPGTSQMNETNVKPASLTVVVLLSLVSIAHLLRLVLDVEVIVGGMNIPMWVSVFGCLIPIVVALALWRESRR